MFGRRLRKLVSSFSLILLALVACATDYDALSKELSKSKTTDEKTIVLKRILKTEDLDTELSDAIEDFVNHGATAYGWDTNSIQEMLDVRAEASKADTQAISNAGEQAKAIKKSPLYNDQGADESSNWIAKASQNFSNLIRRMMDRPEQQATPNLQPPNLGLVSQALYITVWTILGLILIGLIILVARHVGWKRTLKKHAAKVLEDDEPDRTLDEWLEQADRLTREGKYREAVRALYLACLLRFDEKGVARFVRSQTNWEHLGRIMKSDKLPAGYSFHPQTQLFDTTWYGFRTRGIADVEQFRAWYVEITEMPMPRKTS